MLESRADKGFTRLGVASKLESDLNHWPDRALCAVDTQPCNRVCAWALVKATAVPFV